MEKREYFPNVPGEASIPVRAKCYVSRASEDSGRAKIGARAKKGKEQGGGGAASRH